MTAWTIGRVRASGESYLRELGHARVQTLRGRPATPPAKLRDRYAHELGREALDVVLEQADLAGPDSPDARSGRVLLGWLTELEVERRCAPMDDWIADWVARAQVRTADGQAIPFTDVGRVVARERNRSARVQLDAARAELVERELLPTLRERTARARDTVESMAIGDSMLEISARLTGADVAALSTAAREGLARSTDAWRDSFGERLHRHSSIDIDEARPADLAAAVSLAEFDGAFPPSMRSLMMRRSVAELGLDPDGGGRLTIEPALAPAAPPAESVAVEVPREVHVMLGRDEGFDGHRRALAALGSALRLIHVQEEAHFEHRWIGDCGANEIAGLTMQSVLLDVGWLTRYAGLTRGEADTIVRRASLAALYELRALLAAVIAHVDSVDAGLGAGAVAEMYVETVGKAIGVRPHPSEAVLRALPLLHPFARLQAWQAACVLRASIIERFDVDWYRNPRTGPWLVHHVLSPACGEIAADVTRGAVDRDPSLSPCVVGLERLLSA